MKRKLDYAERWLRDGLASTRPPAFSLSVEVDATRTQAVIELASERGIRLTYSHILVRASALTLSDNPQLHEMVCGNRSYRPEHVDVALSVSGETFLAPVLIIEKADRKELTTIADEIMRRTPEVREKDRKVLALLQRWGWMVPLGVIRRALLRTVNQSFSFRRKGSGTFQVSVMSGVDAFSTSSFNTSAILTAGRVRDRVVVNRGAMTVLPTMNLTCSADHRVWDGRACQKFLLAVKDLLESGSLVAELG